jgi:hypothetical protein
MRVLRSKAIRTLQSLKASELWSRPVDNRRLQAMLAAELSAGVAYLLITMGSSATQPRVAAGIVLTTVAGSLGATGFWANSAMDSAIRWGADQIEKNRFGFIGFLDGSVRSLAVTLCGCCLAAFSPRADPAHGVFGWVFPALAAPTVWSCVFVFLLAVPAFGARTILIGVDTPPDGVVLRTAGDWLTSRDWSEPMAGLVLFAGLLLLVTAA